VASPDEYDGDNGDDMVGLQHAKGTSEKTKEMIIDMVQMIHGSERR
jgi:hypothetical protein